MKFQINIKEKESKTVPYPEFYKVTVYAGNNKGSEDFVQFGPFLKGQDEADLYDLLTALTRMESSYPKGLNVKNGYESVIGALAWFHSDLADEEALLIEYPGFTDTFDGYARTAEIAKKYRYERQGRSWPMVNSETPATFQRYVVTFYDDKGLYHETTVTVEQ